MLSLCLRLEDGVALPSTEISLKDVVDAQDAGRDKVEEESVERRESQYSCHASRQHRERRPREVERLIVLHHVPGVQGVKRGAIGGRGAAARRGRGRGRSTPG